VAAFADRHTAMVKLETGGQAVTHAEALDERTSIDEIATMFDGKPVSPESRANARALLKRVNAWKAEHAGGSGARRNG
jgi:DNA repair ATPase RecN